MTMVKTWKSIHSQNEGTMMLPWWPFPWVASLALSRSAFLQSALTTVSVGVPLISSVDESPWIIQMPLEPCSGGCFCVLLNVQGQQVYRAAVDTGSPYLVLSRNQDTAASKTNSRNELDLLDAGYPPTEEIYGSASGFLDWKQARLDFRSQPRLSSQSTILAVMDGQLNRETGGTLLGLVKYPNPPRQQDFFRPTWLQQVQFKDGSSVSSFSIDQKCLTLSNKSLLQQHVPRIPLVDLRPLGDFIEHYNCQVDKIILDGKQISSHMLGGRPIVAVLDTGLTGCLVTQPFWDALTEQLQIDPRRVKEMVVRVKDVTKKHTIDFISGRAVSKTLFYVAPIDLDWFYDPQKAPLLIILGQAFLSQGKLTIDTDDRLVSFEVETRPI